MFDYSHFRVDFGQPAIIKNTWNNSNYEKENEARNTYNLINRKELTNHFLNIISTTTKDISKQSEENYYNRIKTLKNKYTNDILQNEILNYKRSITDNFHNNTCIYKRAKNLTLNSNISKNINQNIAINSVKLIDKLPLNIDKLIYITDYEKELKDFMLYEKMYNRFIKLSFDTFSSLFSNDEEYNNTIELLKSNNQITLKNDTFFWNEIKDGSNLKHKTLLCAFSLTLQEKKYYKIDPPNKLIVKLLTTLFNTPLTASYYGRIKKSSNEQSEYFKNFHYIPHSKSTKF